MVNKTIRIVFKKVKQCLFLAVLIVLSFFFQQPLTYAADNDVPIQATVTPDIKVTGHTVSVRNKTDTESSSTFDAPNIKEFEFARRSDPKPIKNAKLAEFKEILQESGYNYRQKGIMERLYPYKGDLSLSDRLIPYNSSYVSPLPRSGAIRKQEIFEDSIASDIIVKSGRAARERTKKFGLSRATARFNDKKVLKAPRLYGPYLSAMLADEELQQEIGTREEEIVDAMRERIEEIEILNSRFKKAKKAKIRERIKNETIEYGRILRPGEKPDSTFREKLIDMEARRRLQLEDWTTTLYSVDGTNPLNVDKVLRKKLTLHPYYYKYRAPLFLEDEVADRAPEDLIHFKDITPQLEDELMMLVNNGRNVSRDFMVRYFAFSWDNMIHYGPTFSELLIFLGIVAGIRFFFMLLKYNPKISFIVACSSFLSAYAYFQLLGPICRVGTHAAPSWPRLFRLLVTPAEAQWFQEWTENSQEYRNRYSPGFPHLVRSDLPMPSFAYYTIRNIAFWLKFQMQESTTFQSFLQYFDSKILPGSFTSAKILQSIMSVIQSAIQSIEYFIILYKDEWNAFTNSLFLSQVLRSGRKYMPYPVLWHQGICFIIAQFFIARWLGFLKKIDLYIVCTLVPEMRYKDILTAEYVRTYLFIYAVYLIMLGMLHALFGQYYYLPFISEMTDAFFGKRSDFKPQLEVLKEKVVRGGDLSWQGKWEYWKPRKERFTIWHGLFGKPREYKLPKWMRIFNPIWWLKRLRRKR